MYIWLCGFFLIFHVYLNMLAEILKYADREFYLVILFFYFNYILITRIGGMYIFHKLLYLIIFIVS